MGIMAPPGYPKIISTPSAIKASSTATDPVIASPLPPPVEGELAGFPSVSVLFIAIASLINFILIMNFL
jgi:hypothetical protein